IRMLMSAMESFAPCRNCDENVSLDPNRRHMKADIDLYRERRRKRSPCSMVRRCLPKNVWVTAWVCLLADRKNYDHNQKLERVRRSLLGTKKEKSARDSTTCE